MIHRATASFPCRKERAGPWHGTAMRLHPLGSHPCPPGGDSGKHSTLTSNSHCENPRPSHSQDLPRQLKGIQELQSCSKAPPWGPPARSWGVLGLPSPSTNRLAPFLGKTSAAIPASVPKTRIPARHTLAHACAHADTQQGQRHPSCFHPLRHNSPGVQHHVSPPFHDSMSPFSLRLPGALPRPLLEPAGWQRCRAVINGAALPIPGAASRALASAGPFIYFT